MTSRAREYDADRPLLSFLGQRAEEGIERRLTAARVRQDRQAQPALARRQKLIGRNDVDVIDLNQLLFLGLDHRHRGLFGHQLHHQAIMFRIEMGDEDECYPAIGGHRVEKPS